MRSIVAVLTASVLQGCIWVQSDPCDNDAAECVDVSLTLANGDPDGCDLAACVACADECGGMCMIQESYPPSYACEDGGTWNVFDFCPGWKAPGESPRAIDIVDLGCGESEDGERIAATSEAHGEIAVTHVDYAVGCCPESVSVDVIAAGDVLTVSYEPMNDFCDCVCSLDVAYVIVGVAPGTWTLVAGESAISTTVTVQ